MGGLYTVYNVKKPIDDSHIVDKKYVDEMDNLKSAFSLKSGGYEAKGAIFMKKHKLGGLREPTQDGEASTKKYVDDVIANHFVDENDNIAFGRDVDMEGNKIFSLPEPEQDSDPATKKYVDYLQTQYIDKRGNIKFGRNINLDNKRIFALKDPKKDYEATNKKYVDDSITKRLQEEKDKFLPQDPATKQYVDEAIKGLAGGDVLVSKEGVFIKENGHYRATAPLDIDNQKMENLPDPVDEKDAVNKIYIDEIVEALTLKQGLVRENGGFNLVDSYINMNFNNIRNVGYPQHNEDAVPRSFVDDMVKTIEEKVEKHVIAISASYHGDLIKGDYQFTWSGPSMSSYKKHDIYNGFLIPYGGKLKRLEIEIPGLKFSSDTYNNLLDFERSLENVSFTLFTLVSVDRMNTFYEYGSLGIKFYFSGKTLFCEKWSSFKAPHDKITFSKGEIVNIRSEINTANLTEQYKYAIKTKCSIFNNDNYFPFSDVVNEFFIYLTTILIELDPII